MSFLAGLFGGRRTRPAAQYVAGLMQEPAVEDVTWLAEAATDGDEDRARWELRYFRRALGAILAQRDALDDRTGSTVSHALAEVMAADRNVAVPMLQLAERQFKERLMAYREMMALRGAHEGTPERLGRTLLLLSGALRTPAEAVARAAALANRYQNEASQGLRSAFGVATLPEGTPPSAVR